VTSPSTTVTRFPYSASRPLARWTIFGSKSIAVTRLAPKSSISPATHSPGPQPMSRTSSPSVRPPSAMSFGITLLPQSLGSQSTVDVNGLRPIHPHRRNSMTSVCLGPGVGRVRSAPGPSACQACDVASHHFPPATDDQQAGFAPCFPVTDMQAALAHYDQLGFTVMPYELGAESGSASRRDPPLHQGRSRPDSDGGSSGPACY
jgi:hypothetical protein